MVENRILIRNMWIPVFTGMTENEFKKRSDNRYYVN
jgi:hypothetical protein